MTLPTEILSYQRTKKNMEKTHLLQAPHLHAIARNIFVAAGTTRPHRGGCRRDPCQRPPRWA